MSKLISFNKLLENYTKQIGGNRARLLPFISTTIEGLSLSLSDSELGKLKGFLKEAVKVFPQTSELLSVLDELEPDFIFSKVYPLLETHFKNRIVTSYLSLFRIRNDKNKSSLSVEQAKSLLVIFKKYPMYFEHKKGDIRTYIEELFYELPYLSVLSDKDSQEKFITDKTIVNFVGSIGASDPDIKDKLQLLIKLNIEPNTEIILNKLVEILNTENGQPPREERVKLAEITRPFISKLKRPLNQLQDKIKIKELSDLFVSWYSQNPDWKHKRIYMQLNKELATIQDNPSTPQLESQVRNFVSDAPFENLEEMGKPQVEQLASKYSNEFRNATLKDLRILDLGLKGLPDNEIPSLVSNLLDKSKSIPQPEQKKPYFDWIAKLKCGGDSNLITQFHEELKTLTSTDPDFVKKYINYDRGRLFNSSQKRELKN